MRDPTAGLSSLGDVQQLVELMPRPLAQYLRISAVIRATSAALGCTIHDRLRVNATAALEGSLFPKAIHVRCRNMHSPSLMQLFVESRKHQLLPLHLFYAAALTLLGLLAVRRAVHPAQRWPNGVHWGS